MAAEHVDVRHMADIVDSVLACGGERRLAGRTAMRDLVVTARPVPESPPIEVVIVRSPSSDHVSFPSGARLGTNHLVIQA